MFDLFTSLYPGLFTSPFTDHGEHLSSLRKSEHGQALGGTKELGIVLCNNVLVVIYFILPYSRDMVRRVSA